MLFKSRATPQEIILFWTYLKHFLEAGLPIRLAFTHLQHILTKKPWPLLLQKIERNLLQGKKLSASLKEEKLVFKSDTIEMISIAEKKGNYPQIISTIIDTLKWQLQTQQTIKNLLRYPFILLTMLIVLLYIILEYVVPQLQVHLQSLGQQELPAMTRILVRVAHFIPLIAGGITIIIFCSILSFKVPFPMLRKSKYFLEKYLSRLPIIGRLYNTIIIINFIRVLAILLESGLDLLVSLHQAIKVVPNSWLANQLIQSKSRLIQGEKLSVAFKEILKSKPMLGVLIDLGERTGKLSQILNDHVEFEMTQFKVETERHINMLQPTLIVIMGCFLIWVVLSILLPMYEHVGKINL